MTPIDRPESDLTVYPIISNQFGDDGDSITNHIKILPIMKIDELNHGDKFRGITDRARTQLDRCGGLCFDLPDRPAIDRDLLESTLCVALDGGWDDLLSLFGNVALFIERSDIGSDFMNEYGAYDVAAIILLLRDAIKRGDRKKIEATLVAIGGVKS